MRTLLSRGLPLAAATLLLATVAWGDVLILGQPGSHPTLQGAIDAAQDGDVLLVQPGLYAAGFTIDDKALTLLPSSSGSIQVNGLCKVQNLAPRRTVSIVGLYLKAPPSPSSGLLHPGLTLENNSGHVRLQDCQLQGGRTPWDSGPFLPAGPGLEATNSLQVFVTGCVLLGADYGYVGGLSLRSGGDGLHATNSGIALYSSELRGGVGSEESYPKGGKGGAACRVVEGGVFASGCTLIGGRGGNGDFIGCTEAGDGGDALVVDNAQALLLDTSLTPGLAGNFSTCTPGSPGQTIVNNGGSVQQIPGSARELTGPVRTTDNATTTFVVTGQPGDIVWLLRSTQPAHHYFPALHGVAALRWPWLISFQWAGTIGPSGTLTLPVSLGDLIGLQPGWIWFMQAFCQDPAGLRYLTNPRVLLVENT